VSVGHLSHAGHFADYDQQHAAASLGMWVFLITEVMFFGGLFLVYAVGRVWYSPVFATASRELDVALGATNTAILILSSFTMALAVHAAQTGRRRPLIASLAGTFLLGSAFLFIKGFEYYDKYLHHLVPGPSFAFPQADAGVAELFFSLYFVMTGTHALHMLIGEAILVVLMVQAARGRFTEQYHNPVEMTGLYWHFVDIVWILLFPLLYLIDLHR
jgi:cytochrome c oxidase subunit 3